jgi:hypothetical protein
MMSRSRWVLFGAAMVLAGVTSVGAQTAEARLARVRLLRTGDRMSLALEMTAEPRKAALRALSARVLEVEAGPVEGPIRTEELVPPSGVPFIKQVSIRGFIGANGAVFVRARVTLHGPASGNVRVVGRVVYVDFTAAPSPLQTIPAASTFARAPGAPPAD